MFSCFCFNSHNFDIGMKRKAIVSQFSGSYLDKSWARRFILGSVLQNYDPSKPFLILNDNNSKTFSQADEEQADKALLRAQRLLSESWSLPVKMMDSISEQRIQRMLSNYASCDGLMSEEALGALQQAMAFLPGAPKNLADPQQMEILLYAAGYAEKGDNLHRLSFPGALHYSLEARSLAMPYLSAKLAADGGDVYDCIREVHHTTGYAIDSATTSEVDDAIGVETSPTGEEWFTVYVSDATVYCPYDSALEHVTARALATTTYLPEGVFFMLPKAIVEAATLREDKPCRTFNIRFQIDSDGNLKNYNVSVGWLKQLRRITYEQVQAVVVEDSQENAAAPPKWMRPEDSCALRKIYQAAKRRFSARMERARRSGFPAIDSGLPDPYIAVHGLDVISVKDQILSTQESRLAVAELMIAANEVCSRVAQANGLSIPFRGTRILSSNHEAAKYFEEPQGVEKLHSLDESQTYMAEAMHETLRRLSSVTRAMYYHAPLHHAGLLTDNYTHSTSPLRRYPDMLVHHQLKVWLYNNNKKDSKKKSSIPFFDQYISEFTMAQHCTSISLKQERSALLQDKSTRYWILRYMEKIVNGIGFPKRSSFICLVGETKRVSSAPEYSHFRYSFLEMVETLSSSPSCISASRCSPQKLEFTFVSHIYLPEVQLAHTVRHSDPEVKVGAVIECRVTHIFPVQGILELVVQSVKKEGDERYYERILKGGIISHIDA